MDPGQHEIIDLQFKKEVDAEIIKNYLIVIRF